MEWADVQKRVREAYGIQVEPEMARYLLRRLQSGQSQNLAVIGGNAKTGTPMRLTIDLTSLGIAPAQTTPPPA